MSPLRLILPLLSIAPIACAPSKPASSRLTVGEAHAQFVAQCREKVPSQEFCECGWTQFATTFELERGGGDQSEAAIQQKMQVFEKRVEGACLAAMPEALMRASFMEGCAAIAGIPEPALQPFCGCTWDELRKRLSPAQFLQPKVVMALRRPAVLACGASLPEEPVRKIFEKECGTRESAAFCSCAWTTIRKRMSHVEINAGATLDPKLLQRIDATCRKGKTHKA
jgi:hypothetical protein